MRGFELFVGILIDTNSYFVSLYIVRSVELPGVNTAHLGHNAIFMEAKICSLFRKLSAGKIKKVATF
jgi:hypothetical protein